jgi:hypothetical protein
MRGPIDATAVGLIARLAGFDFSRERSELLAPQLDWLLSNAARLETIDLLDQEPPWTFQPEVWQPEAGENDGR